MKKIALFLMITAIGISGCQNNPKSEDIVGIWEAYDCKDPNFVGTKIYLYEDGRGILRDPTGIASVDVRYSIGEKKWSIFNINDVSFKSPIETSSYNISNMTLVSKSIDPSGGWSDLGTIKWKRISQGS